MRRLRGSTRDENSAIFGSVQFSSVPFNVILTQFSRKMGISNSTLHRLEMGEQNVTLKPLEHLSDRFHCKISELFGEK
jgi:transcriptional regulator with XRE-family HTH domain